MERRCRTHPSLKNRKNNYAGQTENTLERTLEPKEKEKEKDKEKEKGEETENIIGE